ncbi:hypothetical protein [Clostridium paraputrificum]|uniref:hypothetical protein n=1 Tax=Clostridium paraputrificum TaxID=29363 RepID=UPI00189DE9B7|nr:hypothetical protein [Clostridium paraputrificum]
MAKGRKGGNIQKTLSFLVYGEQGTWKSSVGAEAIGLKRPDGKPMRVLVIDAEFGGMDSALERKAEELGVSLDNTYIIYTESYSEIMQLLDKAKDKEPFYYYDEEGNETEEMVLDEEGNQFIPDFILVDGSTVIYNASSIALTRFSEKRAKVKAKAQNKTAEETLVAVQGAGLELKDYNKLNKERSQEFILKLISTGLHHYVTARETDEKVSIKGDDGKVQSVTTGNKIPEGFKGMGYNVGTVIRFYINELGEVNGQIINKDRTGRYNQNEILEVPSLLDWQDVIDKNKGKEKVLVDPTFKESIDKEYEKELQENNISSSSSGEELTAEGYHALIKETLTKLPSAKKKTLSPKIKEAGLPMKYQELTDITKLKKYVQILEQA